MKSLMKIAVPLLILLGGFAVERMGLMDQDSFAALFNSQTEVSEKEQLLEKAEAQAETPKPQNSKPETPKSTTSENPTHARNQPLVQATGQRQTQSRFNMPEDKPEICGSDLALSTSQDEALYQFARGLGLSYPETFVRVVNALHLRGRLPSCYMSKGKARDLGWSGGPLWGYASGRAIGGNRFGNREGRLPRVAGRTYREADLDYDGRRRGADRLVYDQDTQGTWRIWVTTDHYESFHRLPVRR